MYVSRVRFRSDCKFLYASPGRSPNAGMRMSHIAIVDDDAVLRRRLRVYLEKEGFEVTDVGDGAALRGLVAKRAVDLVILDLVMPGEDGLSLTRFLRERSGVGILILTGKGEALDRVIGLEMGADDYLAKPFDLRELLARVRSVLRRVPPAVRDGGCVSFKGWRFDLDRMSLTRYDGAPVELTAAELKILALLARNPGKTLSRDQLLKATTGRSWSPFDRSVDLHICHLRRKIGDESPSLIRTVRGFGYVFTP